MGPFMTFQDTCMVQKGSKIWLFLCQIEHGHHMNKDPLAFFRGILSKVSIDDSQGHCSSPAIKKKRLACQVVSSMGASLAKSMSQFS